MDELDVGQFDRHKSYEFLFMDQEEGVWGGAGPPVVKVKDGVSVMVVDSKILESLSVNLIVNAFKTLEKSSKAVQEALAIGAVRLAAKQAVRNNTIP